MEPTKKRSILQSLIAVTAVVALAVTGFVVYKVRFEPPSQDEVDEAIAKREYQRVVDLIGRLDLSTDSGKNYYALGAAHSALGNEDDAIQAYMRADDLNYQRTASRLAIAAIYHKKGEELVSFHWMKDATEAGISDEVGSPVPDAAKEISDSQSWKDFVNADLVRQGKQEFGPSLLNGTWNIGSTRSVRNGTVKFNLMFGGKAISEVLNGLNGHEAVYLTTDEPGVFDYTMSDGSGRLFVGKARFFNSLVITGTMTYLDGTSLLFRTEGKGTDTLLDFQRFESPDNGQTWTPTDSYRLSRNTVAEEEASF